MLDGEMVVDELGNISLDIKTCSGTSVSGTYTAQTSNVTKHSITGKRFILDRIMNQDKQILNK
jgi:hypothetical protein